MRRRAKERGGIWQTQFKASKQKMFRKNSDEEEYVVEGVTAFGPGVLSLRQRFFGRSGDALARANGVVSVGSEIEQKGRSDKAHVIGKRKLSLCDRRGM